MTDDDARWLAALWVAARLISSGIGPLAECDPVPTITHQYRHDAFWRIVSDMMPDDEADEEYWMTSDATDRLTANN